MIIGINIINHPTGWYFHIAYGPLTLLEIWKTGIGQYVEVGAHWAVSHPHWAILMLFGLKIALSYLKFQTVDSNEKLTDLEELDHLFLFPGLLMFITAMLDKLFI